MVTLNFTLKHAINQKGRPRRIPDRQPDYPACMEPTKV
jgi:hypothetical protein